MDKKAPITAGQLMEPDRKLETIREELEQKFRETNGHLDLSKLNSNEPITIPSPAQDSPDGVTLRLRTETGKRTLIVKMFPTDRIKVVYEAVRPYLEDSSNSRRIVLRSNFPQRAFLESETKTLKELGLAPSCALII